MLHPILRPVVRPPLLLRFFPMFKTVSPDLLLILACLLLTAATPSSVGGDAGVFTVTTTFTHAFPQDLGEPVFHTAGLYVTLTGDHLTGVDPKTGLTRYESDPMAFLRQIDTLRDGVLFV